MANNSPPGWSGNGLSHGPDHEHDRLRHGNGSGDWRSSSLRPLSETSSLGQLDADAAIASAASSDAARSSALSQRRACYEQAVRTAIAHQFPLGEEDLQSLRQLQHELQLSDDIAGIIVRHIITLAADEEARYQSILQRYEAELRAVLQKKRMISDADRRRLMQYLSQWGINLSDAALIEQQVRARLQAGLITAAADDMDQASAEDLKQTEDLAHRSRQMSNVHAPDAGPELPATRLEASSPNSQAGLSAPVDSSPLSMEPAFVSGGTLGNRSEDGTDLENSDPECVSPSDVRAKYAALDVLLRQGQWQQADHETYCRLLEVTGRLEQGWLDRQSILVDLPYVHLQVIDRLWQIHSSSRFGFSVQQALFLNAASQQRPMTFSQQVGWLLWDRPLLGFKHYHQLTFSLDAPQGHLPAKWFWRIPWQYSLKCGGLGFGRGGCGKDDGVLSALYASRMDTGSRSG